MRNVLLVFLLALAFVLGALARGEADDASARPTDRDVRIWVSAIQVSRGEHEADLVRKLRAEADRAIPFMVEHIHELARLTHTLTVFDVRDVRDVVRPKLPELEALLTASSLEWLGDGKLVVRATRHDADAVGRALERIRAEAGAASR